jgi:hypothetical protein
MKKVDKSSSAGTEVESSTNVHSSQVCQPIAKPSVMRRCSLKMETVKKAINGHKYLRNDGWFFPSDIKPHSQSFKNMCKYLYEKGFMERSGDSTDRWGFMYRVLPINGA